MNDEFFFLHAFGSSVVKLNFLTFFTLFFQLLQRFPQMFNILGSALNELIDSFGFHISW